MPYPTERALDSKVTASSETEKSHIDNADIWNYFLQQMGYADKMSRPMTAEEGEKIGQHIDACKNCGDYAEIVSGKIQLGEIPKDVSKESPEAG